MVTTLLGDSEIGVPLNHPFQWDFPWNKPSILGYPRFQFHYGLWMSMVDISILTMVYKPTYN